MGSQIRWLSMVNDQRIGNITQNDEINNIHSISKKVSKCNLAKYQVNDH